VIEDTQEMTLNILVRGGAEDAFILESSRRPGLALRGLFRVRAS
jgi:hypothetical protein